MCSIFLTQTVSAKSKPLLIDLVSIWGISIESIWFILNHPVLEINLRKVTLLLCYQYDICFHSFIDSALVAYKYCGTLQNLVLPKVCCIYDTSIFLHLYCNPTLKGNFCIKSIHYYNIWPCTIRFDPHRFCNQYLIYV